MARDSESVRKGWQNRDMSAYRKNASAAAKKRWENERQKGNIEGVRERLRKAGQAKGEKGFGSQEIGADGLTGTERAQLAAQEAARKKSEGKDATA